MSPEPTSWIVAISGSLSGYRRMIDAAVSQLSDEEFFARPAAQFNSVAIILQHLAGNLISRWTDFLTTDGEKPNRDRDREFDDQSRDRAALMLDFDRGWAALMAAVDQIGQLDPTRTIHIRGEVHTLADALIRSVTHLTYHVGQITMVARMVHQGDWQWMTIAPGQSSQHNATTWGSAASRAVMGSDEQSSR